MNLLSALSKSSNAKNQLWVRSILADSFNEVMSGQRNLNNLQDFATSFAARKASTDLKELQRWYNDHSNMSLVKEAESAMQSASMTEKQRLRELQVSAIVGLVLSFFENSKDS